MCGIKVNTQTTKLPKSHQKKDNISLNSGNLTQRAQLPLHKKDDFHPKQMSFDLLVDHHEETDDKVTDGCQEISQRKVVDVWIDRDGAVI